MAEGDIEEKLLEAGKVLHESPASADELLPQLDRVAKLLEKVDQSPSKSMLDALSPIIKEMVEEKLLRNQDEDVRVAVASCISEITRITAPEAPYDDNQMKEVFQLIVSTFENLADKSSHSYSKRTAILETVAKVRSCVVMLDLECDDLIVEMFQHFLKVIRDHHPENVFSNMETIMSLVLEESEEIGFDIISPLVGSLKKDNQEVQPIARRLAENVIAQCAPKIRPCLLEAKSSMNFSFDDYSTIISAICMGTNHVGHDNNKSSGEQSTEGMANGTSSGVTTQGDETKLAVQSSDEAFQDQSTKEAKADTVDGEDPHASIESGQGEDNSVPIETVAGEDRPVPVVTGPEEGNPAPVETSPGEEHSVPMELGPVEDLTAPATPPKSATSNGVAEPENDDITVGPCSEKRQLTNEEDQLHDDASVGGKAEHADSDSRKVAAEVEPKSAQLSKKRSKRTKQSTKLTAPSESSDTDTDKESKRIADGNTKLDKKAHASPSRDPSTEMAAGEENEKETERLSPQNSLESEPENVLSPSPSGSKLNEGRSRSKKGGRSKKKNLFSKKASASEDVASKKTTGGTNNSEVKLVVGQSGKKASARDSSAEKGKVPVKTSEVEGDLGSDSDVKLVKTSTKKTEARDHTGDGSSSKKKVDDKKHVRGKTTSEKETVSSPNPSKAVKDDSPLTPLEETPKTSSKRKRTPSTGKATDVKKHGEDVVGVRIKVWWPMDKMFYEGVVDSFDAKSKKHKVTYTDGEVEQLNLDEERWEKIEDDVREDGEQETRAGSPDTNPELQKKKAKKGLVPSAKKGKTESLRDGVASSSKSKGAAKKMSGKSVDNCKDDEKLAEVTPKSSAKSEDSGGKSKASVKKAGGKSTGESSGKGGKSKDKLGGFEKTDVEDSTKSGSKSKTSKIGSKSSTEVKSGSAKSKESEQKEKSPELLKALKSGKGKSAATPKGKETEGNSGKKRKRT